MGKDVLKNVYWRLPHEIRRSVYKIKYPVRYQSLINLRTELPEKLSLRTYKPFIENKCIFIHIPKTAGTSVSYSLFGRITGTHTTIAEYQLAFKKREFDKFFKFTFIRNPWDRLLSSFIYLKNGGRNKGDYQWAQEHLSSIKDFDDFVIKWVNKKNINKWKHFIPQYRFITTPQNITTLKSLNPDVDFIGFFENIKHDYEYVRNVLKIGEDLIIENKTEGRIGDYRSYYNTKTIEIVSNVYQKDIKFFGYDFENTSLEKQLSNRILRPRNTFNI